MELQELQVYLRRSVRFIILLCAWTAVHHTAVNIYQYSCAPRSFSGFAMSALMISTPHCNALRWIMNLGASSIINTWTIMGSLAVGEICREFVVKSPKRPNNQHREYEPQSPLVPH